MRATAVFGLAGTGETVHTRRPPNGELMESSNDRITHAFGHPAAGAADPKEAILLASPFASLEGESRSLLLASGALERLPKRTTLAEQGEPPRVLALLGSGRVKVERVTGPRIFPLSHRGPGETVGETAVLGSHACESAVVVDDCEALVVPIAAFRKLVTDDPAVSARLVAVLLEVRKAAEDRLASLLLRGVEARLAEFLLAAGARWGADQAGGRLITAPFTHAEIAAVIGSTRETVTLLLGKLRREGLIAMDRRRVILQELDALARRAVEAF